MSMACASKRILVTGASGELGGALALHYARPGVNLSLWGRDPERLEALRQSCMRAGAEAEIRSLDLSDAMAGVAALLAEDDRAPVDLAIFAAGLGDIRNPGDLVEDPALIARLGAINFVTPAAMAGAMAARMAGRGMGNIVLVGSAASFHPLPFAAAYSASKAGLARFADALGAGMREHGVGVTLVSPGFIDTAAARRVPGPKPFIVKPEQAARRIANGVAAGKAHVIFPWPFALVRVIDRLVPRRLRDRILRGLGP